jgi:uncharacterized glyoxalase superfamily protein PhnB
MPDQERPDETRLDQAIASILTTGTLPEVTDPGLAALTKIALALRDLPSEDFKTRLKTELERKRNMPAGFRTVTPFIIHEKAPELVEFLQSTFGAQELKRGIHSEVRIGDSMLIIAGGAAASRGNLPSALHVFVDDCDAVYARALRAGAVTIMGTQGEPADRPYGERSAFVQDAFGNYWYIATRLGPAPAENPGSVVPYLHPENARRFIDFLGRAFGAQQLNVYEQAGRVMHADVRLGDAVLEMGEASDRAGIPLNGFFFFVDDVDAAYQRALAAGATGIRPPADIPGAMRSAIVRDPDGYLWWPARWI